MRKNDTLETPSWVTDEIGPFDLDPCAGAGTRIAATNWAIGRGENGLDRTWLGFVWCNPPFSEKQKWIARMQEHRNGILLLPERGSAPWFGPLALDCGQYWVMGRKINFIGGPSSNNLGTVLFPFGETAIARIRRCRLPGHLVMVCKYTPRSVPPNTPSTSPAPAKDTP